MFLALNKYNNRYAFFTIACVLLTGLFVITTILHPTASSLGTIFEAPTTAGASPAPSTVAYKVDARLGRPHSIVRGPAAASGLSAAASASSCSLTLTVASATQTVRSGGVVEYTLLLHNNGGATCNNVSLSEYYADNESFVASTPRAKAGNYYWVIGNIAAGASTQISVTTKQAPASNQAMHNEVCATGDNASDACVDTTISIGAGTITPSVVASSSTPTAVVSVSAPARTASLPSYVPSVGKEFGAWVWDSPIQMSTAKADSVIFSAKQNGINALYVTIDDYLATAALSNGSVKDAQTQAYFAALNHFITSAQANGIAVDVEGGASNWAEPNNNWKGYALIDFVKQYNAQYPTAKIRAFQYDVESYLLPNYENDKASVLQSYIAFIDASAEKMRNVDAGFSVVVPHFYDSTQQWTPSVTYKGVTAFTFTHLLNVLQQKAGSTLIIMSYRNFFAGADGVQGLTTPELTESSRSDNSTKVIVAQETGNVDPSYVTFYSHSKADYFNAVNTIYTKFSAFSSFGGVATNYIDTFLQLQ